MSKRTRNSEHEGVIVYNSISPSHSSPLMILLCDSGESSIL